MSKMSLSIPNLKYGNQTTKLGPIVQSKYTLTQIRANKRSVWQVLLLLLVHRVHHTYDSGTTFHSNKYTQVVRILYEHHLKIKNSKYRLYTKKEFKTGIHE